MRPEFDIAVVGAGPAGSTAAIMLARAGRRVLLLERKLFPRDKLCGGCLSGRAVARLRELVGPGESLPGIRGETITFVMGSYRVTCHARGTTRLVVRAELDAWLADHAAAAGAEVRFGAEAALCRAADGWELRVADQPIRAALILVASGLGGLSTKLGIAGLPAKRRLIAQEWVQPWVPPLPTVGNVEMHWLRGGYVGLATPAPGRVVVAFSAESPPQPGQSVWQRLRARNPRASIWAALPADAPRRYHALGAAGFPWRPERLGDGNVLLVGDAAGYEEPFSGQGMEQALGSGLCAARAILEGGNVLERYTAAIQRSHRPIQQRLRRLGGLLRSSLLQTLASGPVLLPRSPLAHIVTWAHVSA